MVSVDIKTINIIKGVQSANNTSLMQVSVDTGRVDLPEFTYKALSLSWQVGSIHWNKVVGCLTLLPLSSCQQKHLERHNKADTCI